MSEKEIKQKLKERYWEKTGEELPNHVIENINLLSGADVLDLVEYRENEKKIADRNISHGLFLLGLVLGGLITAVVFLL